MRRVNRVIERDKKLLTAAITLVNLDVYLGMALLTGRVSAQH